MKDLFRSKRIRFAALRPEDAPTLLKWFEDSEFVRPWDSKPALPRTIEDLTEQYIGPGNSWFEVGFGIRSLEDDRLIGLIGLEDIEWNNRVSFMYIGLGDRSVWGKGYASEAMDLFLNYIFHELNFYRIQLMVISYNTSAIKLYERYGFVREGELREAVEREGQRYSLIQFGLLRREWEAR